MLEFSKQQVSGSANYLF